MKHKLKSPFPLHLHTADGSPLTIADEQCKCGHWRTDHADTVSYGHGACHSGEKSVLACSCKQFTWIGFVEPKKPTHKKGVRHGR